ncbi:methylated-DNA--[protein]-cysteine S-methyltransferase [Microvirga massiliensis]|uniref:methylated-DNA--[protein]-cysteine S-methyltransferase n=1 Tax=Microvirga massiliensis TaxID=1033741 RepID=UPI00062B95CE|nr:methylated-DNA--[protein]-cysteine S-methyltransferase [Microvirga massiliensis]
MLDILHDPDRTSARPDRTAELRRVADYDEVCRIIAFVPMQGRQRPSIEAIARRAGLSIADLHDLLHRWAGLDPDAFLQAITLDHAKSLLAASANALEAPRVENLSVSHTPRSRGSGPERAETAMAFGFHPSPFGETIIVAADGALTGLGFADDGDRDAALADMRRRWPWATFREDPAATGLLGARIFDSTGPQDGAPLRILLIGTDFERRVWEALLRIPCRRAVTYSDLALSLGNPKACRAVGAAVGRNPISFVVPCHRVLGRSGALTGYHWGTIRKRAMLGWEAGRATP